MAAKVRKAIIPAAGLGTRFLPATKTIPKEMLPIVDRPSILFIVEEAVRAGIEDIILIAGRHKTAIEDFFDVSYELEDKLEHDGKMVLFENLRKIRSHRQHHQRATENSRLASVTRFSARVRLSATSHLRFCSATKL